MNDLGQAEYRALRDTIRERGSVRMWITFAGFVAWGILALAILIGDVEGAGTLVPLVVLAASYEINFFIHTGVERVGRYVQVFYEEREGSTGWETIAMKYGATFPSGLDPLFSPVFVTATILNLLVSLAAATRRPGWSVLAFAAHAVFAYRLVAARAAARSQRALDLERFRSLAKDR